MDEKQKKKIISLAILVVFAMLILIAFLKKAGRAF
jgi:hypothetical protein